MQMNTKLEVWPKKPVLICPLVFSFFHYWFCLFFLSYIDLYYSNNVCVSVWEETGPKISSGREHSRLFTTQSRRLDTSVC